MQQAFAFMHRKSTECFRQKRRIRSGFKVLVRTTFQIAYFSAQRLFIIYRQD